MDFVAFAWAWERGGHMTCGDVIHAQHDWRAGAAVAHGDGVTRYRARWQQHFHVDVAIEFLRADHAVVVAIFADLNHWRCVAVARF
ncbi:hypothetical protein XM76_u0013, partial [Vibrio vulnificus]